MSLNYILSDIGFNNLLRPIKNGERPISFVYKSPPYNNIKIKQGMWSDKMHLVLDLLYNQKTSTIEYKNLNNNIIRNDKLKIYLKKITEFEFIGRRDDRTITSPIIKIIDKTIHINYKPIRLIKIPIIIYNLNSNSQFLYRRFVSHRWDNTNGIYDIKNLIKYLNLRGRYNDNKKNVLKYLNELSYMGLIHMIGFSDFSKVKITKLL